MFHYRHKITFPLLISLLIIVIIGIIFALINKQKQTTLPHTDNLSVIGVELDQTKDYVDLHQLESHDVSFVYLRSTQGKSYFDDNYNLYRDQLQGTNLAFGTIVAFSSESSVAAQWQYYQAKVGSDSGSLPVLVVPASNVTNEHYWRNMARFANLILTSGKNVMVEAGNNDRHWFSNDTKFLATADQRVSKNRYAFIRYTQNGRVNGVNQLGNGVTMFAYNGSVAQYKQRYGQLTQ